VPPFEVRRWIEQRLLRKVLSPSAMYAVIAAGQALADAGLPPGDERRQDAGLYVGSVQLDLDFNLFAPVLRESLDAEGRFDLRLFVRRGMKVLDPLFLVKALPNSGLCGITIEHQVTGPNLNVTNGAVSGLQAVALAAAAVRRGETPIALAGGYDSQVQLESMVEHMLAGRLTTREELGPRACRPFDAERDGFVLGEAAAFVVLEAEAHARRRAARSYGEVLAASQTTLPADRGGAALAQAARLALRRTGYAPDDLDAVFGDGIATVDDDLREATAAACLLGSALVPFTAATGATGFTGAASGVVSLVNALLAMEQGVIPPTLHCDRPDPRCELRLVRQPLAAACRRVLVWTSDHRGKSSAMVLGRDGA
jgi:3-oxoacyl-[acyl-carrier-protein] synthase II